MSYLVLAVIGLSGINAEVTFCLWNRHESTNWPNDWVNDINYLNGLYEKYYDSSYGWTYYDWPIYHHTTESCLADDMYVYRSSDEQFDGGQWRIARTIGEDATTAFAYCADDVPQDFSWDECTDWYIGEPGAGSYAPDANIVIYESDTCPQILCDTIEWVTDASIESCAGVYTRTDWNTYQNSDIDRYIWFNTWLFSWQCGVEVDEKCQETNPSYLKRSAVPQAWTNGLGAGDPIVLTFSPASSSTHYLSCSDPFTTPSPVPNTPEPTRMPTEDTTTPSPEVTPPPADTPSPAAATPSPAVDPSSSSPTPKPTGPNGTAEPTTKVPTGPNGTAEPTAKPTKKPTGVNGTAEPTAKPTGPNGTAQPSKAPTTANGAKTINCKIYVLCIAISLYKLLF